MKVMSKMGISTYQSYCGAQIFDAVGLKADFVATYFTGTATRIEGVGLTEIAEETVRRHRDAFGDLAGLSRCARCRWRICRIRVRGEDHVWTAQTVADLQHAVRGNSYEQYRAFARSAERAIREAAHHPRPVPHQERGGRRPQAGADRRGRAGEETS